MSDASKIPDSIRALAEQVGLGKAFALAPDIVTACVERGLHPLTKSPDSPTTTPAPVFDPGGYEKS